MDFEELIRIAEETLNPRAFGQRGGGLRCCGARNG